MARHAVAKELPVPRAHDLTLLSVDLQPQFPREELFQRSHDPLARPRRLHVDVAVVHVLAEAVPAPVQFPVEVIEQDVGKQRGEVTGLRQSPLPQHRTCGFPPPAVEPAASHDAVNDLGPQGHLIQLLLDHFSPVGRLCLLPAVLTTESTAGLPRAANGSRLSGGSAQFRTTPRLRF